MALGHREINAAFLEGRRLLASFNKTPSQTTGSGIWYDLSMSSGNPIAQYYSGVTLTSTKLSRNVDIGLNHGQPVNASGFKKYLYRIQIGVVLATAAPLTVQLQDYLMFYSGISMDAGIQTFTNSIALPRYPTGDGVQMMLVEQFPYAGACQVQITYTNSDGVAGRITPILTLNSQGVFGTVSTSAAALAGQGGLYIPLQGDDKGVLLVESIEILGAGDVGVLALVLAKPLSMFQIIETTQPLFVDFMHDVNDMHEIIDDAYLNFCVLPTGTIAGANITGELTTFWSAG